MSIRQDSLESKTNWTEGPWRVGDRRRTCIDIEKDMGEDEVPCLVAEVNTDGLYVVEPAEQAANANLIAAAPCLYEALQLEADRFRLAQIKNALPDERTEQDFDDAITIREKWQTRYSDVFASCHQTFTDEWAVLAKHLRDRALAKARGEVS